MMSRTALCLTAGPRGSASPSSPPARRRNGLLERVSGGMDIAGISMGAVRDFCRDAAQTLLAFGEAPYEIVYYSEAETDKIVGFDFSFIAPWTLKRSGRRWVQTVPKEYSERFKTSSRIELPADSVVRLHLPSSIDRYFSRMMTDLDVLGRDLYPEFGLPVPGSKAADVGYDFQIWQRSHAIALAQATRECGWLARSLFSKNVTEFYFVRRFLRFRTIQDGVPRFAPLAVKRDSQGCRRATWVFGPHRRPWAARFRSD